MSVVCAAHLERHATRAATASLAEPSSLAFVRLQTDVRGLLELIAQGGMPDAYGLAERMLRKLLFQQHPAMLWIPDNLAHVRHALPRRLSTHSSAWQYAPQALVFQRTGS